jgi:hypothetical protein
MLLFCRKETNELAAALRAYLAAVIKVIRSMLVRAEHQSSRFGPKREASSSAGLELIKDWQVRIEDEIDFRKKMICELETLKARLDSCSPLNSCLIAIAEQASLNAAQAGLLPANVAMQTQRLTYATAALQKALRRRLVRCHGGG